MTMTTTMMTTTVPAMGETFVSPNQPWLILNFILNMAKYCRKWIEPQNNNGTHPRMDLAAPFSTEHSTRTCNEIRACLALIFTRRESLRIFPQHALPHYTLDFTFVLTRCLPTDCNATANTRLTILYFKSPRTAIC
jgi:hypothetical protein